MTTKPKAWGLDAPSKLFPDASCWLSNTGMSTAGGKVGKRFSKGTGRKGLRLLGVLQHRGFTRPLRPLPTQLEPVAPALSRTNSISVLYRVS